MTRQPGSRVVATTNSFVAIVLVVLLASVALVVRPPSPPGIAEFAPQATRPITRAPANQGVFARAGGAACGTACVTPPQVRVRSGGRPLPPPRAQGVPSALQCYSWPDGSVTQTFDPQSPPCIATWPDAARGNSGATSPGVTGTEIRVVLPDDGKQLANLRPVVDFINSHFQLYGRHVRLVPFDGTAAGTAEGDAAAAKKAASLKPFASLDFQALYSDLKTHQGYVRHLAQSRIITVIAGRELYTASLVQQLAPYLWTYGPTWEQSQHAAAQVICRELAGQPARHSAQFAGQRRKFAIFTADDVDEGHVPDFSVLQSEASRCDQTLPVVTYNADGALDGQATSQQQAALTLQGDGITTLVYVSEHCCIPDAQVASMSRNGYHPEWLLMGLPGDEDESILSLSTEADELRQFMTVAPYNRILPYAQEPGMQVYSTEHATDVASGMSPDCVIECYHELLLLASGIQAAGPMLTPESFRDGLQSLSFPNPGTGVAPYWQARVGFGAQSFEMQQDLALGWWNPNAARHRPTLSISSRTSGGGFCYVDHAKRWSADDLPSGDHFFDAATAAC